MQVANSHSPIDAIADAGGSITRYLLLGMLVCAFLIGGLGIWSVITDIEGAVIAGGTVVVDSNVKKVQHPTGGIVGEIKVRDGDFVQAGDLVMRLDETLTRANLMIVTKQLDELALRQARLKSERDDIASFIVPKQLQERAVKEAEVRDMLVSERSLFESRTKRRAAQVSQLNERIAQLKEEVIGLTGQQEAKTKELAVITKDLQAVEKLENLQLASNQRLSAVRRDSARLYGERSQVSAALAQARGRIAETELQILQVDQEFKTEVGKEMREIQGKEAELLERRTAAEDQLRRVEIRATASGVVHQLAVHTVGGVINQGEPVMLIVPEDEPLVVEAKVSPQDISNVHKDVTAYVRFTSLNQRTTPELEGKVSRIAPDQIKDPQSGLTYFVARVALSDRELKGLGAAKLVPGMPVEVHIRTEPRSPLSYLLRPLTDQFARAMKEQ
jgi:HlyD family secretion protein